MAIANTAHGNTKTSSTAATTSGAITTTAAIGETIVVAVGTVNTTSNAPTDTAGNTYVQLGDTAVNTEKITFWGCLSSVGTNPSVTCTFTSSRYGIAIATYTGVKAFIQTNKNTATGSASPGTVSLGTTPASGRCTLAGFVNKGTATWSANAAGNLRNNVAGAGTTTPGAAIVDSLGLAALQTCTVNESGSNVWAVSALELSNGNITVSPTGVSAASSVGSVTPTGGASVSLTGVSATSAVGSVVVTISTDVNVSVTGVSATASVGSVSVAGNASVSPTGVSATASVGTLTITGDASISVTGVSAISDVGSVTVSASASVTPTGVSATSDVGSVSVAGDASVSPTGVNATGEVGDVSISGDAAVAPTGVNASGNVGSISVAGDANVSPTGVSATSAVGTVTVTTGGGDVTVSVTGVSAISSVGDVSISGSASVSPTGVGAISEVGSVTITVTNSPIVPSFVDSTFANPVYAFTPDQHYGLNISTSADWTVEVDVPWLILTPTHGSGNGFVSLILNKLETYLPLATNGISRVREGTYHFNVTFTPNVGSPIVLSLILNIGYGDMGTGPLVNM